MLLRESREGAQIDETWYRNFKAYKSSWRTFRKQGLYTSKYLFGAKLASLQIVIMNLFWKVSCASLTVKKNKIGDLPIYLNSIHQCCQLPHFTPGFFYLTFFIYYKWTSRFLSRPYSKAPSSLSISIYNLLLFCIHLDLKPRWFIRQVFRLCPIFVHIRASPSMISSGHIHMGWDKKNNKFLFFQ